MAPSTLLILVLGGVVGTGVVLLVAALRPTYRPPRVTNRRNVVQALGRRTLAAIAVGLLVLVATRWPVAALAAAALVVAGPALFGGAKAEREAMSRLEGLATWTESLRDTIAGAVGLEQAIPATAYAASPAIRSQLLLVVDRLRVRTPLPIALRRLADDLDDPSADMVVAALILNARLRGPGLRQVLTSLSESARAELEMRQRVTAARSSTRRSSQIVIVFSLAVIGAITVFNPVFVEPYDSPTGQLVLLGVAGCFAGGFFWMKRLSGIDTPARFLVVEEAR